MRITHFTNSFFLIEAADTRLVCDPWVGPMKDTATWSFPLTDNGISILNNIKPSYVYISHLHTDHFDEAILGSYPDKSVPIIIKDFSDNRLYNKLVKLGFTSITQQEPWVPHIFGSLELTIVPSDSSTSDNNIDTAIDYDLDTSIIIYDRDNHTVFFNNVDNPLSDNGCADVLAFVKNHYHRKIDVAAICPRAASEYPQCFLNIDRVTAKETIIEKTLQSLLQTLQILRPTYYIPAGGSYMIYGRYAPLDQYVAHPTNTRISRALHELHSKGLDNICFLEGYGSIMLREGTIEHITSPIPLPDRSLMVSSKIPTAYPHDQLSIPTTNIEAAIELAKKNYYAKLKHFNLLSNWEINIFCYESIELSLAGNLKVADMTHQITLRHSLDTKTNSERAFLEIYIEQRLLSLLLNKHVNWNMAASGSLLLYKREPDVFVPDVAFSLNFLTM